MYIYICVYVLRTAYYSIDYTLQTTYFDISYIDMYICYVPSIYHPLSTIYYPLCAVCPIPYFTSICHIPYHKPYTIQTVYYILYTTDICISGKRMQKVIYIYITRINYSGQTVASVEPFSQASSSASWLGIAVISNSS